MYLTGIYYLLHSYCRLDELVPTKLIFMRLEKREDEKGETVCVR